MSTFDKLKDKAEQLLGKAKEKIGEQTGNPALQAEGKADQLAGETKETGHEIKDKTGAAIKDAKDSLRDNK
jgi:uncharacterized protein YjbJ (UPF0337 family)